MYSNSKESNEAHPLPPTRTCHQHPPSLSVFSLPDAWTATSADSWALQRCHPVLRCPTLPYPTWIFKKTCFTEILPNSQEICITLHQVVFSVALDVSSMSTSCGFCTRVGRRAAIPPEMSMWKMCLKPTRHGRRVEFEIRDFFKALVFVDVSKKMFQRCVNAMFRTCFWLPRHGHGRTEGQNGHKHAYIWNSFSESPAVISSFYNVYTCMVSYLYIYNTIT